MMVIYLIVRGTWLLITMKGRPTSLLITTAWFIDGG